MKEKNYILLFDEDQITSSIFTRFIYKYQSSSNIYEVSTTYEALNLLDRICDDDGALINKQEVCFIVDLNMKNLEGYKFLTTLERHNCNCPLRVCLINDETRVKAVHPTIKHYQFAARFDKVIDLNVVKYFFNTSSPKFFKKNGIVELDFRVS